MATTKKTKQTKPFWGVSATDKFMSGWGLARNKTAKIVVVCKDLAQARRVKDNMEDDRTLTYVNIVSKKPSYSSTKYIVTWKDADDCPLWNK